MKLRLLRRPRFARASRNAIVIILPPYIRNPYLIPSFAVEYLKSHQS